MFGKKETADLEEELERGKLEGLIESQRLETTRSKVIRKQLKQKYGKDWKKVLRIGPGKEGEGLMEQLANVGSGFDPARGRKKVRGL